MVCNFKFKSFGVSYILYCVFLFSKLASKRPYTRSHPDPKPPEIVDDPQRIGKRTKDTSQKSFKQISSFESQGSNNPRPRAQSLPNKL